MPDRFTVAKRNSRWVFVTPSGDPFWLRAVYGVVPPASVTDKVAWRSGPSMKLLEWGFNCVGPYSHFSMRHGKQASPPFPPYPGDGAIQPDLDGLPNPNPTPLPYVHITKPSAYAEKAGIIDLGAEYAKVIGWRGNLPDVFDPRWEAYLANFMLRDDGLAWGSTGNPWMLGIMMDDADHLFGFGPGPTPKAPREHPHVADMVRANPQSHSFKALQGQPDVGILAMFADRYFSTVSAAIRRRSPGYLVFSPDLNRWGGLTRAPILKAASLYCDVIQVGLSGDQQLSDTLAVVGDKPLVTWETVVANEDSIFRGSPPSVEGIGNFGQSAKTQEERGRLYAEKIAWLASHPNVAGFQWWAWSDHRGEKTNFGLVNLSDEPYSLFTPPVSKANVSAAIKRETEDEETVSWEKVTEGLWCLQVPGGRIYSGRNPETRASFSLFVPDHG